VEGEQVKGSRWVVIFLGLTHPVVGQPVTSPSNQQSRRIEPIHITSETLRKRFTGETRQLRSRLKSAVETFNTALPAPKDQGVEDVRIWLKLAVELKNAGARSGWDEHRDIDVPELKKPHARAIGAFEKVLADEEARRKEEEERVRERLEKAKELQLLAEKNRVQEAQAHATRLQAEALERQASSLADLAEEQREMNEYLRMKRWH
jgi:hypothetical protein